MNILLKPTLSVPESLKTSALISLLSNDLTNSRPSVSLMLLIGFLISSLVQDMRKRDAIRNSMNILIFFILFEFLV